MKKKVYIRSLIAALLLSCFACFVSMAQQVIKTVIPANLVNKVAASTKDSVDLQFVLKSLPAGAKIYSAKMVLVVAENTKQLTGVELLYTGATLPRGISKNRINFLSMDKGFTNDTPVSVAVDTSFISANATGSLPVRLRVRTLNVKNPVKFYPSDTILPGKAPRLIVYYHLNNLTKTDWAESRADAQHSGQSWMRFKGNFPSNFEAKPLENFNSVSTDLVSYNNSIYLVAQNTDNKTTLYSFDPLSRSRTVIADNINSPVTMPAIDAGGRLYYISENEVSVYDLKNNNAVTKPITFPGKQPGASPTLGPDGSLYLVMNDVVTAYSPFPQHQKIWQYALTGLKSAVTLNYDGSVAYLVSYGSSKLLAINTNNGNLIKQVDLKLLPPDEKEGPTIPLVDMKGNIYVTNKLINGNTLYVFDASLNRQMITGSGISQPVLAAGKGAYYVNNGKLYKTGTDAELCLFNGVGTIRSLVTDGSNNVFCLTNDQKLYAYYPANLANSVYPSKITADAAQKAMIMGTDGSLFTATSNELVIMRPPSFTGDYSLTIDDKQQNLTTFRANTLTIPVNYSVDKRIFLVGKTAVNFQSNVSIEKTANVVVEGGSISFQNGFTVKQGATLSCKTGY